jgi:hypothetical protein
MARMPIHRRLLAISLVIAGGCRMFDAGLADRYDGGSGKAKVPRDGAADGVPDAPHSGADAAPSAPDRRPDEPTLPGPPAQVGCADGTREGFPSLDDWPNVAGCSGAWSIQGLLSNDARAPACNRQAGNDGANSLGQGCSISDLCAVGWHVCRDAADVGQSSPSGCESAVDSAEPRFFLVASGASPQGICTPDDTAENDLHGCGTLGQSESSACDPLNRRMTFAECQSSGVWSCGGPNEHLAEAAEVTKSDGRLGGVLCCRDI